MARRDSRGFTLIELMIVVAVVAILAAIALPAFNEQMRKGRRAEAIATLQGAQLRLERWRTDNANFAMPAATVTALLPNTAFYRFTLETPNANSYTLTAAPQGGQANDICSTLRITNTDGTITKTPTGSNCW